MRPSISNVSRMLLSGLPRKQNGQPIEYTRGKKFLKTNFISSRDGPIKRAETRQGDGPIKRAETRQA